MTDSDPYRPPTADLTAPTASLSEPLNPWLSIWTRPRATIQQIVDVDPKSTVLLLACVGGISQALSRASMRGTGDELEWPLIVVVCILTGPIIGLLGLYLGGVLLLWTGKWLGGTGTPETIRAALAWANVPAVWGILLWLPELALFGQELFTTETPRIAGSAPLSFALLGFGAIELVIGGWALIILFKCLGQVQGFSAWRALASAMLAGIAVLTPIVLIAFAVVAFAP